AAIKPNFAFDSAAEFRCERFGVDVRVRRARCRRFERRRHSFAELFYLEVDGSFRSSSIALSVVIKSESESAGEVIAARLVNQISASSTRSATGISQKNIITTSFPSEGRGAKAAARSSLQLINSAGSHRV